ncbi:MAG: RagB/SusD family nutrient uptake outer membrane protein [Flavobacteriales bacterium]|nr:RagB/SusD family nutrient uptake outer membrane protein [Flavobacteriales bacterium]
MKLKNIFIKGIAFLSIGALGLTSCMKDLDQLPIDPNQSTAETVYQTEEGYSQVLAKLYAGLSLTGQEGPAGNGDVGGIDEGTSSFVRNLWNAQVLTTDEAICSWGDFGIPQLNFLQYSAANPFIEGLYYRTYHMISVSNEFLSQSSDSKLDERGQGDLKEKMKGLRAEARFIRAYSYYVALDLFGNVPFVDESMGIGSFMPEQMKRADLFDWIITEIDAFEGDLKEANTADYGRVDKGAAWMLKAKMYLNAKVYTGTAMYDKVVVETEKVNSAYTFYTGEYNEMFYGDNNKRENAVAASGFIFVAPTDGFKMQTYGATQFLAFSATGGDINPAKIGISGGWGGNRSRAELVDRFDSKDLRGKVSETEDGMFFITEEKVVTNPSKFTSGYSVMKFRNVRSDGATPANLAFVSTDFPLFRLADSYLMYAEAAMRGAAGAEKNKAVEYVNKIRTRAYGNTSGNITAAQLTKSFVLDERGRELFWEATRRTDLVRFGEYTSSSYLWSWKGGVPNGAAVSSSKSLFAIPAKEIGANSKLVQNPGY